MMPNIKKWQTCIKKASLCSCGQSHINFLAFLIKNHIISKGADLF